HRTREDDERDPHHRLEGFELAAFRPAYDFAHQLLLDERPVSGRPLAPLPRLDARATRSPFVVNRSRTRLRPLTITASPKIGDRSVNVLPYRRPTAVSSRQQTPGVRGRFSHVITPVAVLLGTTTRYVTVPTMTSLARGGKGSVGRWCGRQQRNGGIDRIVGDV